MAELHLFPDPDRQPPVYKEWRQSARRAPTDYETLLGDALEAAFGSGITELPDLVVRLNADGIRTPEGAVWTEQGFRTVIAALAEGRGVAP